MERLTTGSEMQLWGVGEAGGDTPAGRTGRGGDGLHTHDPAFGVHPAGVGRVAVTGGDQQVDRQVGADGETGAFGLEVHAAGTDVAAYGAMDRLRNAVLAVDSILQRQPNGQSSMPAPVCVAHGRLSKCPLPRMMQGCCHALLIG